MARKSVKKSANKSQTSSRVSPKGKAIVTRTKAPLVTAVKPTTKLVTTSKTKASAKGAAKHNMTTSSTAKAKATTLVGVSLKVAPGIAVKLEIMPDVTAKPEAAVAPDVKSEIKPAVIDSPNAASEPIAKPDPTLAAKPQPTPEGKPDAAPAAKAEPMPAAAGKPNIPPAADAKPEAPDEAGRHEGHSMPTDQTTKSADMAFEMGHGDMDLPTMVRDIRNRFWICLIFAIPIFIYAPMGGIFKPPAPPFGLELNVWLFFLASAAVLYPSWMFVVSAWRSLMAVSLWC